MSWANSSSNILCSSEFPLQLTLLFFTSSRLLNSYRLQPCCGCISVKEMKTIYSSIQSLQTITYLSLLKQVTDVHLSMDLKTDPYITTGNRDQRRKKNHLLHQLLTEDPNKWRLQKLQTCKPFLHKAYKLLEDVGDAKTNLWTATEWTNHWESSDLFLTGFRINTKQVSPWA